MLTDVYTRGILTVIALCLVWLCLNGLAPAVTAQAQAQRVVIVGWADEAGRPLVSNQGLRVTLADQTIPITMGDRAIPVVLKGIERGTPWEPIQVDVNRAPATLFPGR